MKTLGEYLTNINNGIAPPSYIPSGGVDYCDVCGGNVTWPPTGEPCQGVCNNKCDDMIHTAWMNRCLEATKKNILDNADVYKRLADR